MNASRIRPNHKRVAHDLSFALGRITRPLRMTPGLLIVGGQRCGTTSMYRALAQHPAMAKPVLRKGVHYFDVAYTKDMKWYQSHFPLRASGRHAAPKGVEPIAFESSPYYLFHPLSAARIAERLPGVKVIALVRDPVERAYSAHAHESARGYESEPFERALELEEERLRGEVERIVADPSYESHAHRHQAYVRRGQYAEQLEQMSRHVGRGQVLVVDSHRFFAEPEREFAKVLTFLDLLPASKINFERHNARSRSPMADRLRQQLKDHFAPHDAKLASWLEATPSWRL
ncbi:MAG: sulfotransferase [Nocardioidaceae bacterium]